jgi:glucose/arabinose dehydrogenase
VNAIPRYETSPGSGIFKAAYSIPVDNPFVHTSLGGTWNGMFNGVAVGTTYVRSEFWAVGMRNPWRIAFDPQTNELWCGDVGQDAIEEVDIITRGANYGWAYFEASGNGPKIRLLLTCAVQHALPHAAAV